MMLYVLYVIKILLLPKSLSSLRLLDMCLLLIIWLENNQVIIVTPLDIIVHRTSPQLEQLLMCIQTEQANISCLNPDI